MTDLIDIHPDFTEELQKEWEKLGFKWEEVQKWIERWCLHPNDADFALYLGERGYIADKAEEDDLEELRSDYNEVMTKNDNDSSGEKETTFSNEDWKNINSNFTPELIREWINHGFNYQDCADWINISSPSQQHLAIKEPFYYAWLRNVKKVDAEWVLNYGEVEKLQNEYRQYLLTTQQIQII